MEDWCERSVVRELVIKNCCPLSCGDQAGELTVGADQLNVELQLVTCACVAECQHFERHLRFGFE